MSNLPDFDDLFSRDEPQDYSLDGLFTLSDDRQTGAIRVDYDDYKRFQQVLRDTMYGANKASDTQFYAAVNRCRVHRLRAVLTSLGIDDSTIAQFIRLHESTKDTASIYAHQLIMRKVH